TTLRVDGCNGETAGINGSAPARPSVTGPNVTLTATVRAGPLNFRPRPTKSAGRTQMLHRGEQYTAIGRSADNIWVQLDINGTKGWAMTEFLTLSGDINSLAVTDGTQPAAGTPSAAMTATPATPVFTGVQGQALGNMRLRSAPNTQSDRVGGVNWGQTVNILGRSTDGEWLLVEINGLQGWTSQRWYTITQGSLDSVPVLQ
ncbi:MAG: SH3 domain-containing protein, partial [Anaerolineae bacterium]|nr:SH3 domain-containing protein [Anaerolineae bacterium]